MEKYNAFCQKSVTIQLFNICHIFDTKETSTKFCAGFERLCDSLSRR